MGAFDDLIPATTADTPAKTTAGVFDDLVPDKPMKEPPLFREAQDVALRNMTAAMLGPQAVETARRRDVEAQGGIALRSDAENLQRQIQAAQFTREDMEALGLPGWLAVPERGVVGAVGGLANPENVMLAGMPAPALLSYPLMMGTQAAITAGSGVKDIAQGHGEEGAQKLVEAATVAAIVGGPGAVKFARDRLAKPEGVSEFGGETEATPAAEVQTPAEGRAGAPPPAAAEANAFEDLIPKAEEAPPVQTSGPTPASAPAPTIIADQVKHPVVEVPLKELKLSEDVPNFKAEADADTGVVAGQQLEGKYERLGTGAITVYERANGQKEVISGRHRFDLARRTGETTIPAQIVREAEGFTPQMAMTLDAEMNIRDGQGSVGDYANYFRNASVTAEEAAARGLLSRAKGQAGWALGRQATGDLYALYRADKISEPQAVAIAASAPGEEALQRVGARAALDGAGAAELRNFIQAVRAETKALPQEQFDLFAADDSALTAARDMARTASRIQTELSREIKATQNAAAAATTARAKGITFERAPEDILAENETLKAERDKWDNWALYPELVQQVRDYTEMGRAQAKPKPTLEERLDSLKVDLRGKVLEGVTSLPIHLWNGAIDAIKLAVRGGKALKDAIEDGIAWLKTNHPATPFDEQKFRDEVEAKYGEREFGLKLKADADIIPQVKSDTTEYLYEKRSNETDLQAAQRLVAGQGLDKSITIFKDDTIPIPGAVRSALGKHLIKALGAAELAERGKGNTAGAEARLNQQIDLIEHDLRRSTDIAQSLQAMSIYGDLSPEGMLRHARKTISEAGDQARGELKPAAEAIGNGFRQADETAIEGVRSDPDVNRVAREAVNEAVENSPETKRAVIVEVTGAFAESPVVVRQAREALRGQLDRVLQKQGVPLGTRAKSEFGAILDGLAKRVADIAAGHYQGAEVAKTLAEKIQERTGLSEEAATRLAKQLDKRFAEMVEAARKKIPQRVANQRARQIEKQAAKQQQEARVRQSRSVWSREKQAASDTLVKSLTPGESARPTPIQELAGRLVARMREQLEPIRGTKAKKTPLTPDQLLREAVDNADKYEEIWEQTKADMYARHGDDPSWQATLDEFFRKAAPEVFSDALVDKVLRRQIKTAQVKLGEVVKQHASKVGEARQALGEQVLQTAGLKGPKADQLRAALDRRFNELATAEKKRRIKQLIKDGVKIPPKVRSEIDRIIEASNLGAFDDASIYEALAKKLDLPELTPDLAREITRRANAVQELPEGFQRDRAAIQLLNYISTRAPISFWKDTLPAFWYANILSGPTTHLRNTVDNLNSLVGTTFTALAIHPGAARQIPGALTRGFGKGGLEAADVLRSGLQTGSRLVKVEGSRTLELNPFKGSAAILNNWKYVGRALAAADTLVFKPLEEVKAALLARDLARREGLTGEALQQRVADILGDTEAKVTAARAQAANEGLHGLDARRRVNELIEQGRETAMPGSRELIREFGLRATYNNTPYGVMGIFADMINGAIHRMGGENPAAAFISRTVVPFTNIVANVINEKLNYTPVGAFRVWRGYRTGELYGQPLADATARSELLVKALVGTTLTAALTYTAAQYLHDPDPPFAITGNGPNTPAQRRQLEASGWKPHAIKLGHHYVSYMNTPPALMLMAIGNYMDGLRYRHFDQTSALDRVAIVLKNSGDVVTQQSFLDGIANLFATMGRENSRTGGQQLERWAARTSSGLVVPNLAMQIDRLFDPTKYDDAGAQGVLAAQIPFVRRLNRPALNILGEPVEQGILSRDYGTASRDALWTVLAEKQAWIPEPGQDVIVGDRQRGPDYFRALTEDERYEYVRTSGQAIREKLENNLDKLASMEPEAAQKEVQKITREARKKALKQFGL